ncbi:hypothetical protein DSO57_1021683 [Entomophthora muscae]|uniref:Uncharacterized protein n=1 Tax=Entomophthora muscae TaxID=34485 RepID=A0ACC2U1R8_9FUNG|nr:hypothetical protein DSO57_1021683 [Entomophthora muscae]
MAFQAQPTSPVGVQLNSGMGCDTVSQDTLTGKMLVLVVKKRLLLVPSFTPSNTMNDQPIFQPVQFLGKNDTAQAQLIKAKMVVSPLAFFKQ